MAFIVTFEALKRAKHELEDGPIVIGRERKATLPLSDFQVSRRHAEIEPGAKGYTIKDLGSRNGFYLNTRHIGSGGVAELFSGDALVMGRTGMRFYVEDPGDVARLEAPDIPEAGAPVTDSSRTRQTEPAEGQATPLSDSALGPQDGDDEDLDDEELLRYAASRKPEARRRFTELSEEVEDWEDEPAQAEAKPAPKSARAKKPSARKAAAAGASSRQDGASSRQDRASSRQDRASSRQDRASSRQDGASSRQDRVSSKDKARASERGRKRSAPLKGQDEGREAVSAEVGSLRVMLERAERDRRFYRNLVAGLIIFLMLIVGVLLIKVMAREEDRASEAETGEAAAATETPGPSITEAPTPSVPTLVKMPAGTPPAGLDRALYQREVLPWLRSTCDSCHGSAGKVRTNFRCDFGDVDASLAAVARYVIAGSPENSFLILKPLSREANGEIHGGGALLDPRSDIFRSLIDWVNKRPGEEKAPAAPKADLSPSARIAASSTRVETGQEVSLDSSGSQSRTRSSLLCEWALIAKPPGSRAVLDDESAVVARFTPDKPGAYEIELIVQDGELSGKAGLRVVAEASANEAEPPPKPAEPAAKPEVDDATFAALFQALVGRAPKGREAEDLRSTSKWKTARKIARGLEAKKHWVSSEVAALGLTGQYKPRSYFVKILAKQLQREDGALTPSQAQVEIAISASFQRKHSERRAYVEALFEAFLGRKPSAKERFAALKMCEGEMGSLLGEKGRGSATVAAILSKQPEAIQALIRRSYKLYTGSEGSKELIDEAAQAYQSEPEGFFDRAARWLVPKSE